MRPHGDRCSVKRGDAPGGSEQLTCGTYRQITGLHRRRTQSVNDLRLKSPRLLPTTAHRPIASNAVGAALLVKLSHSGTFRADVSRQVRNRRATPFPFGGRNEGT